MPPVPMMPILSFLSAMVGSPFVWIFYVQVEFR